MNSAGDAPVFRMENITKRFGGLNALSEGKLSVGEGHAQALWLQGHRGAELGMCMSVPSITRAMEGAYGAS